MTNDPLRMAFLDDRHEQQETVIRGLASFMPQGWELVKCPLQTNINAYVPWIERNNVVVLLVDQLLNEKMPGDVAVDYKGHQVVAAIRKMLPDFPIVVATRADTDPDLLDHFGEVDDIVNRTVLLNDGEVRMKRYTRLGQRFMATYEKELAQLTKLSEKAATKRLTKKESEKMRAIRAKLNVELAPDSPLDTAIDKMEGELKTLNMIAKNATSLLKSIKSKRTK